MDRATRLLLLEEILPDVSARDREDLVDITATVEAAVQRYFSRQQRPAAGSTVRETLVVDDDDTAPLSLQSSSAASSPSSVSSRAFASQLQAALISPVKAAGSGNGGKRKRPQLQSEQSKSQRSIASFFGAATRISSVAAPAPSRSAALQRATASSDVVDDGNDSGEVKSQQPLSKRLKTEMILHDSSDRITNNVDSDSDLRPLAEGKLAQSVATAVPAPSPPPALSPLVMSHPSAATSTAAVRTLMLGPPCWQPSTPVPYLHLARAFHVIEHETGRLLIVNYLTLTYWRILALSSADLLPSLYLTTTLAPPHENLQLHVGGAMLAKCVRDTTGNTRARMSTDWKKFGDLGTLAQLYSTSQTKLITIGNTSTGMNTGLTVRHVYATVISLAAITGTGNKAKKETIIKKLLLQCREFEVTYIVRTCEQNMRIHSDVITVLTALAKALVLHAHHLAKHGNKNDSDSAVTWDNVTSINDRDCPTSLISLAANDARAPVLTSLPTHSLQACIKLASVIVRSCYSQHPNLRTIVAHCLAHPLAVFTLLSSVHLVTGIPTKPMLGKIANSVNEMIGKFRGQAFSVEIKYDGLRAQIHRLVSGEYRLYSRHLIDQSERWHDLIAVLNDSSDAESFILDTELVAVEVVDDTVKILPFQEITTRKRKVIGSGSGGVSVSVMIVVFDLIYLSGQSLLPQSLAERRSLLYQHFREIQGKFQFVESVNVSEDESAALIAISGDNEEANDSDSGSRSKSTNSTISKKSKQHMVRSKIAVIDIDNEIEAAVSVYDNDENISDSDEERESELSVEDSDEVQELASIINTKWTATATASTGTVTVKPVSRSSLSETQLAASRAAYDRVVAFLHTAVLTGEGVMAKLLSAEYAPDLRTDAWVKLKKDYIGGLSVADSIDCVPIGAWYGNGRKAGWYSPVLLAVYNDDSGQFETLCKCMSGFTDSHYQWMLAQFEPHLVPSMPANYHVADSLIPTLWFKPVFVWEIRGADLTLSPNHTAGIGEVDEHRGISLRFPRFLRERDDKGVSDATTSQQIAEWYQSQPLSSSGGGGTRGHR